MSPSTMDDNFLMRLRQLLKDPTGRSLIQNELNSGGSGLGSTLVRAGQSMASSTTPGMGGAMSGLGQVLGAGLGTLLKKKKGPTTPGSSQYSSLTDQQGTSGPVQDNYGVMASAPVAPPTGQQAPVANVTQAPVAPPATPGPAPLTGKEATSLMIGRDAQGNTLHSTDGGQTWMTESGQVSNTQVYQPSVIGPGIGVGSAMAKGGRVKRQLGGGIPGTRGIPGPFGPFPQVGQVLGRGLGALLRKRSDNQLSNDVAGAISGDDGDYKRGGKVARGFRKDAAEDLPEPAPQGRAVLLRRPVPVVHTTIVIGVKKKGKESEKPGKKGRGGREKPAKKSEVPEKKAKGGELKVAANQHQRSVMPTRGWGIATRGRKATRIY